MKQVSIHKMNKDGWAKVTIYPINSKKLTKSDKDWVECMIRNNVDDIIVENKIYQIVAGELTT